MSIAAIGPLAGQGVFAGAPALAAVTPSSRDADKHRLHEVFNQAVGETLFGQMLKSMRRTVGKPAYFHGGRAEEIFQQQLDQVLAEKLSQASAAAIADPMFELFTLQRA